MKRPRINLRRQLPVYSPLGMGSIVSGLRSALAGSSAVHDLARRLDERYSPHDLTLTDSGTSALALAIRAAGGPVALPAFCCYDVATACDQAGAQPILYDLNPYTLAPDRASLSRAIVAGARSVVAVHLYGVPVSMRALRVVTDAAGVVLIEDAAQGTGAWLGGHRVGTMGAFGILSFGRGKGVTGGGGGALLADDATSAAQVEALEVLEAPLAEGRLPARDFVATVAQWALARPAIYNVPASLPFLGLGNTVYHAPWAPAGMSAFSAGVLTASLHLEDREAEIRRRNAAKLTKLLERRGKKLRVIRSEDPSARPGYLRLPVLVDDDQLLERLRSKVAVRLGVLPSYPVSLADLPGFRERVVDSADDFAGARRLAQRLVTMAVHSRVRDGGVEQLRRLIGDSNRMPTGD